MSFYLKQPRGTIQLHILKKCVDQRLEFFDAISHNKLPLSNNTFEYLIEDTAFDRAGHFVLRLKAACSSGFGSYFHDNEVRLLDRRLKAYKVGSAVAFLKTLSRHANECYRESSNFSVRLRHYLVVLVEVLAKMLHRSYRKHAFDELHEAGDCCELFTLYVPFEHAPSLLPTYKLEVKNGLLHVGCENWKSLLVSLYSTYLRLVLTEMRLNPKVRTTLEDTRIQHVLNNLSPPSRKHSTRFSRKQIVEETKYFPLCMQNLLNVLQEKHRLAHEDRFNLSLFLKDIGFSLEESIGFWRQEYSKQSGCSKCSHNWEQDEKRYVYGIRHMYGLEGGRNTYRTRSCSYLQGRPVGALEEGGCPFKHFDNHNLKLLLNKCITVNEVDVEDIMSERLEDCQSACVRFSKVVINELRQKSGCDNIRFSDPVQYYFSMKELK